MEDKLFNIAIVLGIIVLLSLVFGAIFISPQYQAKIYNERYETNYTAWDFFWAKSQINQQTQTIRLDILK